MGIDIASSSNNQVINNTANSNTQVGIYFWSSSNNTLTNNTADSNSNTGIDIAYSSNNQVTNNTANSNLYGIALLVSSNNNQFLNNKITKNTVKDFWDTTGDSYVNYLIYNNSFGEIKWNDETNGGFLKNLNLTGDIGLNTNL